MDKVHLHLLFNHLPIIVPVVGILVMIGGIAVKSEIVKRSAFLIFILGALWTWPAMFTGDGAEDLIENLSGVSEQFIHEHEEKAEVFALLSYALGLISIIGLWANLKKKSFAGIIAIFLVVFAMVVMFFAKQTGTSGGEIRHPEIRSGILMPAAESEEED